MTQYRFLERLGSDGRWSPDGVAYLKNNRCVLYRGGQTMRLSAADDLTNLGEDDFPLEEEKRFRWTQIEEWDKSEAFDPEVLMQLFAVQEQEENRPLLPANLEQLLVEIKQYLLDTTLAWQRQQEEKVKQYFVYLYDNDHPPPRQLVEVVWRHWTTEHHEVLPFSSPKYNVALLLYARAFGLPVHDNPVQKSYLAEHADLYAPLVPASAGYGARAAVSGNVLAMLDSPVMHVWLFKDAEVPQRIVIVGRGLAEHREQVFSDALVTAMRVQASDLDMLNEGLISIERKGDLEQALDFQLPALGADAPLADADTAEAAMREFVSQLRRMGQNTGFVEVHEADISESKSLQSALGRLAKEAKDSGEPLLWAPDPSALGSEEEEVVTVQPVLALAQAGRGSGPRGTAPPMRLKLSPELLTTEIWRKLIKAYDEQIIKATQVDAQIRLAYYQQRVEGLRGDKEQWDKADDQQRQERWGATVTLNQRFDDEIGLAIWLHPPDEISTKQYYDENVPGLIRSHESWAAKMRGILKSLETAAKRPDDPFFRLLTTRLFDAALRGRELEHLPRIQKLYREWVGPIADLLRFEWRKRLDSLRAKPEHLFTTHTTFNLRLIGKAIPMTKMLSDMEMVPYTLLDRKRSVAMFDRRRGFMVVNDPSDFPERPAEQSPSDLRQVLLRPGDDLSYDEMNERLRQSLLREPRLICRQVLDLLKPQISGTALSEDSDQVRRAYQQGLQKMRFTRLVNLADNAMRGRALLTARESLRAARQVIPDLLAVWGQARESAPGVHPVQPEAIPEPNELKCRLHLMETIAECLATDFLIKERLPALYRSPQTGGRPEIRNALAAADNADPAYTRKWIERLSNWDLGIAYNELLRGLPNEQELTSLEEYSAVRAFDLIKLLRITKALREATATLGHVQERRESALVKLGPALESGLLSQVANIAYGDLNNLLALLTGRQVAFDSRG